MRYSGRWLLDDDELFPLIETNFQKAVDGNCADYLSAYVLGYLNLAQEKQKKVFRICMKSIELNEDYASAHYNLAYAYLYTDDMENALKYAKLLLTYTTKMNIKAMLHEWLE